MLPISGWVFGDQKNTKCMCSHIHGLLILILAVFDAKVERLPFSRAYFKRSSDSVVFFYLHLT